MSIHGVDGGQEDPDDRIIREALDRKPSPYPSLLMPLGDDRDVLLTSDRLSNDSYIDSYFQAATKLSDQARLGLSAQEHEVILPILFLYRHFVELSLKSCNIGLARLIHVYEPSVQNTPLEGHSISKLLNELRTRHGRVRSYVLDLRLPSQQALQFIDELAKLDETSEKFRYVTKKRGRERALDEDLSLNLDVLGAGMRHVYKELRWYSSMIATEADLQEDFLSDSAP